MNENNKIIPALDGTVHNTNECLACQNIADNDVYILSPLWRLRNGTNYVLMHGIANLGDQCVHRAIAVTIALCDGKRTISDIAQITRPLVKIEDNEKAIEIARHKVKDIVYAMSRTKEERLGRPPLPGNFPPDSALVTKAAYDTYFAGFNRIEYCARDFLPKNDSEKGNGEFWIKREAVPTELHWHLTSECSTDCKYCYLNRRKVKLLPIKRTLSLIEEAAAIGVLAVKPMGGDILLYPHLQNIFEMLSKYKFLPVLLSTKSFLSKEMAKMLADSQMVYDLQISIDSTISEVAHYLVGRENYCRRIFTSIDNALEAGLPLKAKAVITSYNILTIPQLYRDLKKRGVKVIHLGMYTRSGFHHSDDLFIQKDSYAWLEKQIQKLQEEFPNDYIHLQGGVPMPTPLSKEDRETVWKGRINCQAGRSTIMICADGKVIPCEQMPETEEYFCGDVNRQSIMEVWNSECLRDLTYGMPREKFKGRPCYDCEEREKCQDYKGTCIRDLSIYHGNIYQPDMKCPKSDLPFVRLT